MPKVKEKELDIKREWNAFVRNLAQSKRNWEKLNKHFSGSCDIDKISEELGDSIVKTCRTNKFCYAIEDFIYLCGLRGSITDFIIETKKNGD